MGNPQAHRVDAPLPRAGVEMALRTFTVVGFYPDSGQTVVEWETAPDWRAAKVRTEATGMTVVAVFSGQLEAVDDCLYVAEET